MGAGVRSSSVENERASRSPRALSTLGGKLNKEVAKANLRDVCKVLNEAGVTFWLDCGTLLGAIRDRDFFPWDDDIDLGSTEWWMAPAIHHSMLIHGFEKYHYFGTPDHGYEMSFYRDQVKVDIFFAYPEGNDFVQSSWYQGGELLHDLYRKELFPLRPYRYYNAKCFIPNDPAAFLTTRYGDWHEEVKEWHYQFNPHNLRNPRQAY